MPPKKSKQHVSVPGLPSDPPFPVKGKSLMKVGNWILKGVQKAHHGQPELLQTFSAWRHFTGPVVLPQYVQNVHDHTIGDFDFNLRQVKWSVDDFVRQAMADMRKRATGAERAAVVECQGEPTFTLVVTDNLPSPAPWVHAYEYAFRLVWVLPRGLSLIHI